MLFESFLSKNLKKRPAKQTQKSEVSLEVYLQGRSENDQNPDWQQVEQKITNQLAYREEPYGLDYSFLILTFHPANHEIQYIQMSCDANHQEYVIEIRCNAGKDKFSHYRLNTDDAKDAYRSFQDAFYGKLPDLKRWEDVTEEMTG